MSELTIENLKCCGNCGLSDQDDDKMKLIKCGDCEDFVLRYFYCTRWVFDHKTNENRMIGG